MRRTQHIKDSERRSVCLEHRQLVRNWYQIDKAGEVSQMMQITEHCMKDFSLYSKRKKKALKSFKQDSSLFFTEILLR